MTRLRHADSHGPQDWKDRPFRLFEAMRERRYGHIVSQIDTVNKQLEALGEKNGVFAALSKSSQASILNEDESNWNEAMAYAKAYRSCRKTLKSESRIAAFDLFSQTMFKVALFGGASLVMLHFAMPGMTPLVAGALGALFTLGAVMRTWGQVSLGTQDFLHAVSAILDEQKASLEQERRQLIKRLHGWKKNED